METKSVLLIIVVLLLAVGIGSFSVFTNKSLVQNEKPEWWGICGTLAREFSDKELDWQQQSCLLVATLMEEHRVDTLQISSYYTDYGSGQAFIEVTNNLNTKEKIVRGKNYVEVEGIGWMDERIYILADSLDSVIDCLGIKRVSSSKKTFIYEEDLSRITSILFVFADLEETGGSPLNAQYSGETSYNREVISSYWLWNRLRMGCENESK